MKKLIIKVFEDFKKDGIISNFDYISDIKNENNLFFYFENIEYPSKIECNFIKDELKTTNQLCYHVNDVKIIENINKKYKVLKRKKKLNELK